MGIHPNTHIYHKQQEHLGLEIVRTLSESWRAMLCSLLGSERCMMMHCVGWSREAISSSLMIIFETTACTEFTSSSNISARIGWREERGH